jgi:hypothetical protein
MIVMGTEEVAEVTEIPENEYASSKPARTRNVPPIRRWRRA